MNEVSNSILFYLYKVVISVCLFVCPIITLEPLDRFGSNFDWGTRETNGNVLSFWQRWVPNLIVVHIYIYSNSKGIKYFLLPT